MPKDTRNCLLLHIMKFNNDNIIYARNGVELTKKFNEEYPLNVGYSSLKNLILSNNLNQCRLNGIIKDYKQVQLKDYYHNEIEEMKQKRRKTQRRIDKDGNAIDIEIYERRLLKNIIKKLYDRDNVNNTFRCIE